MPKYNYHCNDCQKTFNMYHKVDEVNVNCIHCNSSYLVRLLNSTNILQETNDVPVGTYVQEMIEENKSILAAYKRELKND